MAVETVKSTQITNRDSAPKVLNNARITKMAMQAAVATVEATAAASVGSKYIMCTLPSNARVKQVLLSADASGATGSTDIGVYQTTDNGSAVVSAALFGSAVVVTSAITNSDITHESGTYGIEKVEMPLWQALGLSSDPRIDYDVVLTLTAIHANGGTLSLHVEYGQ